MADVALPASLASLLLSAPADSSATTATAQPADPFAALFATVAVAVAPTPNPTAPIETAAALPAVATLAIVVTPPTAAPLIAVDAAAVAHETASVVAEKKGDEDKADTGDTSEDPFADAIASGANAVLAFIPTITSISQAPAAAPPAAPVSIPTQISVSTPHSVSARAPAPVVISTSAPTPKTTGAQSPVAIDGPMVTPRKLPTIGWAAPARVPFKTLPQPIAAETAAPDTAKVRADADNPPALSSPTLAVAAEEKPVATPLSPETMKAVIAALRHDDQATTQTAPAVNPIPVANVHAEAAAQAQQPLPQAGAQQTAKAPVSARRASNELAPARRAGSDSRKWVEPAAAESIPVGFTERAAHDARAVDPSATVAAKGDTLVEQTLSIARDGAWLDTLAKDIANSAGSGNDLHFKLNPPNLGSLTVAIAQTDDGTSIRLTAETHETRNILLDAQPKLIAEARTQGLRISDSQVDLNDQHQSANQDASRWAQGNASQNGSTNNGQNRQSSPAYQPFVSNLGRKSDIEPESPPSDSGALYA